jgi:dolichyl-phosphate-mannose--protein O-mannosyl transferase
MYDYHANLDATHPFSSNWYEWPIMANPVWFYSGGTMNGLKMTISDFGNPAISWCGVLGFIYLIVDAIRKKNMNSVFLLVFILSTYVPYIFVGRLMFMYHFFITLPFIMLGIVSLIKWITEKVKNNRVYYGYIILIITLFIIFYPVISGKPTTNEYVESLRWLPRWYF